MKTVVGLFLILACIASAKNVGRRRYDEDHTSLITQLQLQASRTFSPYTIAALNKFPFQVAIILSNPAIKLHDILCQGVLVTEQWILTTASCISQINGFVDISMIKVFLGTVDFRNTDVGFIRRVGFFMFHPDYDHQTKSGKDLAMWMLKDNITIEAHHVDIAYLSNDTGSQDDCKYSSFTHSGYLLETPATVTKSKYCNKFGIVDDISNCVIVNITSLKDYQRGSPLTCGGKVYALKNSQGYFTTVYDTSTWILRVIDAANFAITKRQEYYNPITQYLDYYGDEISYSDNAEITSIFTWETSNLRHIYQTIQDIEERNQMKQEADTKLRAINDVSNTNRSTSNWSEARKQSLRKRRFAQGDTTAELQHLFSAWAITISKLNIERQIDLKMEIGNMVSNAEMDYLREQKHLESMENSSFGDES